MIVVCAALLGACTDKQLQARAAACEGERDKRESERDAVMKSIRQSSELFSDVQRDVAAVTSALDDLDHAAPADRAAAMKRVREAVTYAEADAGSAATVAARAGRLYIHKIPKQCLDNPLAAGCGD